MIVREWQAASQNKATTVEEWTVQRRQMESPEASHDGG